MLRTAAVGITREGRRDGGRRLRGSCPDSSGPKSEEPALRCRKEDKWGESPR